MKCLIDFLSTRSSCKLMDRTAVPSPRLHTPLWGWLQLLMLLLLLLLRWWLLSFWFLFFLSFLFHFLSPVHLSITVTYQKNISVYSCASLSFIAISEMRMTDYTHRKIQSHIAATHTWILCHITLTSWTWNVSCESYYLNDSKCKHAASCHYFHITAS